MPNKKNTNQRRNGEIDFKVIENLGVLETYQTGWTKEVNIIAWNGGPPKIDIRDWDPDHERMSRGITLHPNEARNLVEALNERFAEDESWNFQGKSAN